MKNYVKPELEIEEFELVDVITSPSDISNENDIIEDLSVGTEFGLNGLNEDF